MQNKRHILFLSSWYPTKEQPFLGNFVQEHARIAALDNKVTVLNVLAGEKSDKVIHQNENLTEIWYFYPTSGIKLIDQNKKISTFKKAIKEIEQVDLIHANISWPNGWMFFLAKKKLNVPLILSEHASYFREENKANWSFFQRKLIRKTLKEANLITSCSQALKDLIQSSTDKSIEILPNLVHDSFFKEFERIQVDVKRFLHVSTVSPIKNIAGIIDAVQLLSKLTNLDFRFTIVSDESLAEIELLIKSKQLTSYFELLGPKSPAELAVIYENHDVFVLNSRFETFSIVIAEAWATGMPIISTSVGIATNCPPNLGWNVEQNNPKDLANKLLKFMTEENSFDSNAMKSKAKEFNSANVRLKLNEIYDKVKS